MYVQCTPSNKVILPSPDHQCSHYYDLHVPTLEEHWPRELTETADRHTHRKGRGCDRQALVEMKCLKVPTCSSNRWLLEVSVCLGGDSVLTQICVCVGNGSVPASGRQLALLICDQSDQIVNDKSVQSGGCCTRCTFSYVPRHEAAQRTSAVTPTNVTVRFVSGRTQHASHRRRVRAVTSNAVVTLLNQSLCVVPHGQNKDHKLDHGSLMSVFKWQVVIFLYYKTRIFEESHRPVREFLTHQTKYYQPC